MATVVVQKSLVIFAVARFGHLGKIVKWAGHIYFAPPRARTDALNHFFRRTQLPQLVDSSVLQNYSQDTTACQPRAGVNLYRAESPTYNLGARLVFRRVILGYSAGY